MERNNYLVKDGIVYTSDRSGYAGKGSMAEFLRCLGLPIMEPHSSDLSGLKELPPSFRDFHAMGGNLRVLDEFSIRSDRPIYVVDSEFRDFLRLHSRGAFEVDYDWAGSPEFANRYFDRKDVDGAFLAGVDWFDRMIVIAAAKGGIYLLNPFVRTSDNEWEAWISSHRYGAYRFSSFAEMLGHIVIESSTDSIDMIRYDRDNFEGTCAEMLFRKDSDKPRDLMDK